MTSRDDDRLLRFAAVAFVVAVAIHGADHQIRGLENQSRQVVLGGTIQAAVGAGAVALVFLRHRWAAVAAAAVGFASAILFAGAHLLPAWGVLSDSYVTPAVGAGVTWFSWTTAALEIAADLVFGWVGLTFLARARTAVPEAGR